MPSWRIQRSARSERARHLGDTDVDAHYARLAGFELVGVTDPMALTDGRLRLLSGGMAHDAP